MFMHTVKKRMYFWYQENVSWILSPRFECEDEKLLLLISSGPKNRNQREFWRKQKVHLYYHVYHHSYHLCHVQSSSYVNIVFMVAIPISDDKIDAQKRLEKEQEEFGDILQPSIEDGHRKLGYKNLAGWFKSTFCIICFIS